MCGSYNKLKGDEKHMNNDNPILTLWRQEYKDWLDKREEARVRLDETEEK